MSQIDRAYTLDHAFTRESGRIYITGVQALVRLPLEQRRRDLAAGLDTAGFISGYRGSPLGTYDLALWRAREHLTSHRIRFEPGVNEDLAATAVWGSQQAHLYGGPRSDGVGTGRTRPRKRSGTRNLKRRKTWKTASIRTEPRA